MKAMEMEGMEGAILIFMLGNMEQTVARKQTKREKNNAQKRTEGWKQKGIWLLWYAVVPVFAFYLMECYEHNPFAEVRVGAQLFNIFLFELIGWMLYFLTGRMCFASRVLYGLAVAFGITNHYVMKFRSTPFVPWDLFSAGTAASVAGNYDFTPDRRMVIVTLVFIALFVLTRLFKKGPRFSWKIRLGSIVLVGLVLCTFVNALQQESFQTKHYLYPFLFTPAYMTKVNGMAVTFAMDLAYVAVERPAGYDADEAKETLAKYETKTTETDTQDLPNIIVIMDEAFSDLKVLGPLETNEDYMPFMHRMQQGEKNTVTGYVQTSVCGGNTADSEFEFLTGNTMAFLPNGSIPYQQYIKSRTPSLAGYLKSLGYATYAQHPYQASGWNRDKVYPLLGFDNLDFMEDYKVQRHIRHAAHGRAQHVPSQRDITAPVGDEPGQKADEKFCDECDPAFRDVQRIRKVEQHTAEAGGKAARQGPEQQAGQRAEHIAQMNARYLPDGDLYPAEYEYQSAQQARDGQPAHGEPVGCFFHEYHSSLFLPCAANFRLTGPPLSLILNYRRL